MNIWLLQIGEPIPIGGFDRKGRLSYLCDSLAKRGHRIIRWGSAFNHLTKQMISEGDADIQISENYTVKLIRGLGYKKNISIRRWLDHLILEKRIVKIAKKMDLPDVIFIAIPPHGLAYEMVRFARKMRVPVIVDIRDQWPDIFVDMLPGVLRKFGKYIFAYEYFKLKNALSSADSITAMMEDLLLWGLDSAKREKSKRDKVFYIGNHATKTIDLNTIRSEVQNVIKKLSNKIIFTFIGTFNNFYNPSIIVEVAKLLEKDGRNDIAFVLAGNGGCYEEVAKKAEALKNVTMTGWLNQQELMAVLNISDVGICPLNEDRPCFPNKVFNYLSAYLPVISSTPGEFERLINDYRLGIYYKPGDKTGLYNAVLELSKKELRNEMSKNVRQQFSEQFDAERIYSDFAKHIEDVASINK